MLRAILLAGVLAASAAWSAYASDARPDDGPTPPTFRVAATAIVRNATISAMYNGMVDRLRALGYRDGDNIVLDFEDAGADTARAAEIVRGFVDRRADVIVAFTLPSVRAALGASGRTPVVASGLDDEAVARLNRYRRARPLTGIVRGETHEEQFRMIRAMLPDAHAVAVPVDADAEAEASRLREIIAVGRAHGFAVMPLPVSLELAAISADIRDLPDGEAAMLIDRGLLPGAPVEALVAAASDIGLPVFATDEDSVVRGAVGAMLVDPFGIGQQTGDLVARILAQPGAARQPFSRARATRMILNRESALQAALDLPRNADETSRIQVLDWSDDAAPRPRLKPAPPLPPTPAAGPADGPDLSPQAEEGGADAEMTAPPALR